MDIKRTSGRSEDEHRIMSHPQSILGSTLPLAVTGIIRKLQNEQKENWVIFPIPVSFILVYAVKTECSVFLFSVTANIVVIPVNIKLAPFFL